MPATVGVGEDDPRRREERFDLGLDVRRHDAGGRMASRGGGGGRGGAAKRGRGGRNPGKQQRSAWSNSNKQAPGADREITCKDCSASFTFTARAQALHHEQGYGDPVRCQPCRKSKRERNESDAAAQASGQPRAGLTYEEKRVLGKNRKERRAEAAEAGDLLRGENAKPAAEPAAGQPAAGQTFSKGMDPQEARLLRLAREGKMKRAMHKPEERANLNAVQDRLQKQGEAAALSQPSAAREGGRPIHKRIRDLERRLARGNLPDDLRVQKEAEVKALRVQQQDERENSAEEKIARRYKMVKFFEERKIIRRIRSAQKRKAAAATTEGDAAAVVRSPKLTLGFSQSSYILMTYRVFGAGRGVGGVARGPRVRHQLSESRKVRVSVSEGRFGRVRPW
eukprot:COSAG03_NODE_284_length_9420_cov_67.122090_6_plen_395_part_00